MRVLAFSDIHNNLDSIRLLREREENTFDCVAIAGDFGNEAFWEILEIAKSFDCPVVFVCGNWDNEIEYDQDFGSSCHLLHLNVIDIEGFAFAGYSGVDVEWGRNPIAKVRYAEFEQRHAAFRDKYMPLLRENTVYSAKGSTREQKISKEIRKLCESKAGRAHFEDAKETHKAILIENRNRVFEVIQSSGRSAERVLLMSHGQTFRLHEGAPGLGYHLFGHKHGFKHHIYKGTHCINVSAIDRRRLGFKRDGDVRWLDECELEDGTYTTLELRNNCEPKIRMKKLLDTREWGFADGWKDYNAMAFG